MARGVRFGWAVALGLAGCATSPPLDNPVHIRKVSEGIENPVLVSPGVPTPASYQEVFEACIEVLNDYFDILSANLHEGRIVTKPRIAPGYEQFWKSGNPDPRERLLATFQTIRQSAVIEVRAGERGGYLVYVVVEKELEDLSKPAMATIGNAVFQEAPTVDRQVEVIGPGTSANRSWFRIGRDYALEQRILSRVREGK